MCGRYMVITEDEVMEMRAIIEELGKRFGGIDELPFSQSGIADTASSLSSGEVFPGNFTPVMVLDNEAITFRKMRWGFSKWDGNGVIINARSESVSSKSFFGNSLQTRRCIVPSHGFFEWKKSPQTNNSKLSSSEKYVIRRRDSSLFLMSGIYQICNGIEEFAIITMPAMDEMADLHDRMPLFVMNTQVLRWLESPDTLVELLSNRNLPLMLDIARV